MDHYITKSACLLNAQKVSIDVDRLYEKSLLVCEK